MNKQKLILSIAGIVVIILVIGAIRRAKNSSMATPETINRIAQQSLTSEAPENSVVPSAYASTYSELNKELDNFAVYLKTQGQPRKKPNLIYAAELLTANGNQGPTLLTDAVYQANIQFIDRLQELGIQGVKININFPLLLPSFQNSSQYLNFYEKIAQELRKRNMKILVQMTDVFSDPVISPLKVDYSGLTPGKYAVEKKQQAQIIIDAIKPDFLTIDTEPGTAAQNTGLKQLKQPAIYTAVVEGMIKDLPHPGIQLGAGVGSWDNIAFVSGLSKLPLDYIDLHVYPLSSRSQNYLTQAVAMAKIIEDTNKKVILDETWLYKTSASEAGGAAATSTEIFKRDTYSFWAPLDQKFLGLMAQMANRLNFEFISPFWDKYFFAYLPYNQETAGLSAQNILTISSKAANINIAADKFTSTGLDYKKIIETGGF